MNLTRMGLGRDAFAVNFPNLKQSFIDSGWIVLWMPATTLTELCGPVHQLSGAHAVNYYTHAHR